MKRLKFEVELDIEGDEDFTTDEILKIGSEVDWALRKIEDSSGLIPIGIYRDIELIRVKVI
jgi:hypothetical protein